MAKGKRKRIAKAQKHLPHYLGLLSETKWSAKKQKGYARHKLGKFGAASQVRIIKPEEN
jgi:hypothetical protein